MADQIIPADEPAQTEVEAAWLAHNEAIVDAGAEGITGIEAMRVALRAAAAHRRIRHEDHAEFVDGCYLCEFRHFSGAYREVKDEQTNYRRAIQVAIDEVETATRSGNLITPHWVVEAVEVLKLVHAGAQSGPVDA